MTEVQGLTHRGVYETFRTPQARESAIAAVRAMIPPGAKDVREIEVTRCSGCGAEYCPNEPAFFGVKWLA